MLSISVDVSEAKEFLAKGRQEGAEKLSAVTDWARSFVQRGLEAMRRAELTVLLEREIEAGESNSRNGYRLRRLSLSGLGELGLWVPRDRQGRYRSGLPFRKRRGQLGAPTDRG